jgi:hypothetical protein
MAFSPRLEILTYYSDLVLLWCKNVRVSIGQEGGVGGFPGHLSDPSLPDVIWSRPYVTSSNKRGFRHPDVLSGRSAPTTGRCRMKPPPPAVFYTVDGR